MARERNRSPFELGGPRGPKARHARFCEPELVCEVSWTEWTREGTLRQPAFKGMRDDNDPGEVVREEA
jgi:bifunctional non-homologous end joining protein LigD